MLGKTVYKEIFPDRTWVWLLWGNGDLDAKSGIGIRIRDTDLREIRVNVWRQCSDEKIEQKVSKRWNLAICLFLYFVFLHLNYD